MSGSIVHHATVDKGLKMKIKRKNVSLDKSDKQKKDNSKLETAKTETKGQGESGHNANGMLADKGNKLSLFTDKEKSPKSKNSVNKKDKGKALVKGDGGSCGGSGSTLNGGDNLFSQNTMEPKLGEMATGKKECMPDPYEFNAKVEDGFSVPMKKMKIDKEKGEVASGSSSNSMIHLPSIGSPPQDVSTDTCDMAVSTEPECLGPCEPGTHVNLEGIVWHESDNGVLVVNVTWRGKTYVGTLLDATRHDWAPPRLNCDSPTSEFESRTPKGRGKRRGASNTPVNDTRTLRKGRRGSQQTFTAPPSPAKSDISVGGIKRKGRPQDIDLSATNERGSKRSRSASQVPTPNSETPPTDSQGYIECPEPNCNKKYRHANGLKYHQSHAHSGSNMSLSADDSRDIDTEDMPLSVVKSAVKKEKEKEIKKESNKKDSSKDTSSPISDKSNKMDTKGDKVDKDTKDSESESKDSVSKSDAKCDSASKKKESGGKQTVSNNNSKASSILPNSSSKSSAPSATSSPSSQTNSASNSVIAASQSASSGTSSSAISNSSNSGSAAPVSNTVTNSPSASEAKMDNKLVDIKPKIPSEMRAAKSNRPIVPAPSPQVLGNVQVTHSNLSPVMSHTQMSPRPIQPKPTIMGETQNINPALADLNKDRKKLQKKKTLKDGAGQSGNRNDQPTVKIERTGVIKTNPLPHKHTDQSNKKDSGAKDGQRPQGTDPQRSQTQGSHKALDMSHSKVNNNNMNMLKVGSPLQVATPDNHHKAAMNEDVQSPAYSDISDANESASPAGPSDVSPQKHKDDNSGGKKDETVVKSEPMKSPQQQPLQQTEGGQMMQHYGMPPYYYGQSQYGMNMSPSQKTNTASGSGNVSSVSSGNSNQKENMKGASSDDKKPAMEDANKGDKKPDDIKERENQNRPKGMPPQGMHPQGVPGSLPSNLSPQQMADFKMQQNWYQQMYIQSLPPQLQYQYMANGWYPPVDPAYMQQVMEDHRRGGEPGRPERDGAMPGGPGSGAEGGRERGPDMKGQQGPGGPLQRKDDGNSGQRPLPSPGQSGLIDRNDSGKNTSDDKSIKDQALREKQNENHQILKENIDLKYEMDKNRQEYQERMRMQNNAEERRRMYQEQKMIEERKKMELSARKGESRAVESLTSKPPGTKPVVEHSPRNMLPGQQRPLEDGHREIKRESFDRKDGRDSYSRDGSSGKYPESTSKCGDDKSRTPVSDKHRPESVYRNPETPKHRPGGSSSKSGSPSTSLSSSVPGSPSFSPYLNNYPPYNPKFLGMDPMYRNHNVNPAMISGYQGYIHPSQMGYRPSPADEKDTKSAQKSVPSPSPVSDPELKKSGELANRGGPYYGNMHKIHELTEKARPRSRNSSPGPVTSSASYDKHRDYTNSPPTQRHVHTHHHTHVLQPGPGLPPAPGLPAPLYDPYSTGKY